MRYVSASPNMKPHNGKAVYSNNYFKHACFIAYNATASVNFVTPAGMKIMTEMITNHGEFNRFPFQEKPNT